MQTPIAAFQGKKAMSFSEVMQSCGITEDDIENAEDLST